MKDLECNNKIEYLLKKLYCVIDFLPEQVPQDNKNDVSELSLIAINHGDTYMTVYNAGKDLLNKIKLLAEANGLFMWKPKNKNNEIEKALDVADLEAKKNKKCSSRKELFTELKRKIEKITMIVVLTFVFGNLFACQRIICEIKNEERILTYNISDKRIYDVKDKKTRGDYIYRHNSELASPSVLDNGDIRIFLRTNERVNLDNKILKDIKPNDIIRVYKTYSDYKEDIPQMIKENKEYVDFKFLEAISYKEIWNNDYPFSDDEASIYVIDTYWKEYKDEQIKKEGGFRFGDLLFKDDEKLFLKFECGKNNYVYVNAYDETSIETHYLIHYEDEYYGEGGYLSLEPKFFVQDRVYELVIDKEATYNLSAWVYNEKKDEINPCVVSDGGGNYYEEYVDQWPFAQIADKYQLAQLIDKHKDLPYTLIEPYSLYSIYRNYSYDEKNKENIIEVSYIEFGDDGKVTKIYCHDPGILY